MRARNGPPMISSEVQRTLVKSPPELWAELSDPASLARHLGELGEIRITRVEPEKTVEWEAADTTGKVLLKASGWGTKVTLTAAREVTAPEAIAEPEPVNVVETEPEAEPVATVEPPPEPATAEPEPEALVEEPVKRPGFFARLFGRRPKEQTPPQPIEAPESTTEPRPAEEPKLAEEPELIAQPEPEPEPELTVAPQPAQEQEAVPQEITPQDAPTEDMPPAEVPDIAAELRAAEEAATAEVTAVLTAVLDRLGAAHHRPFSRS